MSKHLEKLRSSTLTEQTNSSNSLSELSENDLGAVAGSSELCRYMEHGILFFHWTYAHSV